MVLRRRDKGASTYSRLNKETLQLVQRLSGQRWTDYNAHDPGVTLLEIICYGLLDLHYKLDSDFSSYLVDPLTRKPSLDRLGLLPADRVFSPTVVTTSDYEMLLKSHIQGIRDCDVQLDSGYYSIRVVLDDPGTAKQKRAAIFRLYHRHRNLGEQLNKITFDGISDKRTPKGGLPDDIQTIQAFPEQELVPPFAPDYRPIRLDLPDCYGVNERGAPAGISPQRHAQLLQLKAYLMLFDQMRSLLQQQVAQMGALMSLSADLPRPFSPTEITDPDRLLDQAKLHVETLLDQALVYRQKAGFFNVLDVVYGENTQPLQAPDNDEPDAAVNRQRANLLRHMPDLNRRRNKAMDITDTTLRSIPTVKQLVSALLGNLHEHEAEIKAGLQGHETFYIVEHILLLDAAGRPPKHHQQLTVILHEQIGRRYGKSVITDLFAERLPAHLLVHYRWVAYPQIEQVEFEYFQWKKAWAARHLSTVIVHSSKLRKLL